ncbi:efflux RND transporter permease subunit [Chloroflexia bacterium SDU3-3]|nr:efflux RND transporter permease subunit [Chloroflexia bacterium SDU3-3]
MSEKPDPQLHGMALSDTAIRRPVLITVVGLLAIVIGLLAYSVLPVDYLPDYQIATVAVTLEYAGASPQTMEDQVARPVEDQLTTISGVRHITSVADEGQAMITVEFQDGVSPDAALQAARDKVNAALPSLPSGVATPVFQQFNPNTSPIMQLAITGDGGQTPLELRALIDETFVPAVERASGVGAVSVSGGQERQINVLLDLDRMQARGISPAQVTSAIASANPNLGLGSITSENANISMRAPSQITQPADVAALPITGTAYRVADVATVQDGVAEASTYARLNGQDAVTLAIFKQAGTNTVQVAQAAKAELDALIARTPQLQLTITNDQSIQVQAAIASSIEETILAVLVALLVVLLFFRDLRNTLVTVAGLPIIIIATFAAIWAFGLTINTLSLVALSLSVGLVIDDAIVVRENIFRYLEQGASPVQAASRATAQVASSVLAMTLTVIAVFLPTAFTAGTAGIIFKTFGITIACAMAISLVEAFTWAPMLSAHLFKGSDHPHDDEAELTDELEEAAHADLGATARAYVRVLDWSLQHRWVPLVVAVVVLAASVGVAFTLRFTFLPAQENDTFGLGFQSPPGASLAETDRLARQAEPIILADPGVAAVQTLVGATDTSASSTTSAESAAFTIKLHDFHQADAVRERLREQLAFLPGLALSAQSSEGSTSTAVTSRNVQVQIHSTRPLDELAAISAQVQQQVGSLEGFSDIGQSYSTGKPEVQLTLNTEVAGQHGLSNADVASLVQTLVNGTVATYWQHSGEDIPIMVQLPAERRQSLETINQITIPSSQGSVPLRSLTQISLEAGPTSLRRYDRQNEIVIGANVAPDADQNRLQQALNTKIAALGLPADVRVSFGGQTESQDEAFATLFGAMWLAILFVYVVLAAQFESFTQPLVIMLAMPFSFIGAFLGLKLTNLALDVTSMVGLITLLGLVVKNSILLVDVTNQLRKNGMETHEAIKRAGAIRLRPILMTSVAIIGGSVPTALGLHILSSGQGGEYRQGLAVVLIGGVLASTLLTLLVVPTAYSLLDSLQSWLAERLGRSAAQPALATQEE